MALIYLYTLIKTVLSKNAAWSSFSTQTIVLHTIALGLSWSIVRDAELHRAVFNNADLTNSAGFYIHMAFIAVQTACYILILCRRERVSEWLQNYDVRMSIIGKGFIFFICLLELDFEELTVNC